MDALKCINTRRSIRKYKARKIPADIVKKLIVAGMNAPSSFNSQPWVFITVTKKDTMNKIASVKSQRSQFLKTAPLLIACCYDESRSKSPAHDLENVAVAVENILLAAHALGLGACYIGGFDPKFPDIEKSMSKALKLPKKIKIVCLISLGYPDESPKSKTMRKISEVLRKEHY
ncbi:MAG: nitroreductase family protein [Candidatus Nanoarchaeia archaeon]|nr:nitroreductase family protein [Candidatus Nanoarchaeia archaeon]MDD5054327.1 nitroreductase family protein [Candidatus Nanoarchaeia archaeon]MDD5499336.1 nitroreductase family protein [Candidatus Nanoarchaeia archaeon]